MVPLPNGNFRVGVHIADVASFVPPGSALDAEAAMRATSVYLVQASGIWLAYRYCNVWVFSATRARGCFT